MAQRKLPLPLNFGWSEVGVLGNSHLRASLGGQIWRNVGENLLECTTWTSSAYQLRGKPGRQRGEDLREGAGSPSAMRARNTPIIWETPCMVSGKDTATHRAQQNAPRHCTCRMFLPVAPEPCFSCGETCFPSISVGCQSGCAPGMDIPRRGGPLRLFLPSRREVTWHGSVSVGPLTGSDRGWL